MMFLVLVLQTRAQVTGLSIRYSVSYDCYPKAENEEGHTKGGCHLGQTLDYKRKKHVYKTKVLSELKLFWEWKGGFQPNSIQDSVTIKRLLRRRKLPAEELESYLESIVQLKSDSVMVFRVADFSENEALIAACHDSSEIVSQWKHAELDTWLVSSVITRFEVAFTLNEIDYLLVRSEGNPWRLYFAVGEKEEMRRFINTGVDAFLTDGLPKSFHGKRVISNRHWEEQLANDLDVALD